MRAEARSALAAATKEDDWVLTIGEMGPEAVPAIRKALETEESWLVRETLRTTLQVLESP
jgi:hypothetical protein